MDIDAFDPRTPDVAFIGLALKALAKKWASKPRAKSAKPRA
jgi:hypothetical protein